MELLKKITLAVLSILGSLVVIGFVWDLVESSEKRELKEMQRESLNEISVIEQYKDEFVTSCADGDTTMIPFCDCTYKELLDSFGEGGLIEFSVDYATGKELSNSQAEKFFNSVEACDYLIK